MLGAMPPKIKMIIVHFNTGYYVVRNPLDERKWFSSKSNGTINLGKIRVPDELCNKKIQFFIEVIEY